MTIRLGTRGSALALWQANWVAEQLRAADAGHAITLVPITTAGDRRTDTALSELAGRGVFVGEIEAALLAGAIDIAVHSAKDLPSVETPGTRLAAFCERADPRDALVAPRSGTLTNLPQGARVATGSARRAALLRHARPDLQVVGIRGNVDTRLEKLARCEADALVLAGAGLTRLGRAGVITEWIDPEVLLPQVGQGCVAVQTRSDDAAMTAAVAHACDHPVTRREVQCERTFLARLGGGCDAPVGAYAISSDRFLYLFALVARRDGSEVLRTRSGASIHQGVEVARGAYDDLMARGAGKFWNAEQENSNHATSQDQ